jgi:hypothetical protein
MDKGREHLVKGIIYEYGDGINIEDGELVAQGCLITEVVFNEETDKLEYYAGDMEIDEYAEQVFPNETEIDEIFDYIIENF